MSAHKTMSETLALCDYARAKRGEPTRPLQQMTPAEQAKFWRQPTLLERWLASKQQRNK
jgi:hypothetical protein